MLQVKTDGTDFTTLHHFNAEFSLAYPMGLWRRAGDSSFYGIVSADYTSATMIAGIFKVSSSGIVTVLTKFNVSAGDGVPVATLVDGRDGFFYGAALNDGRYNAGSIYKLDPATGSKMVMASFKTMNGQISSTFNGYPAAFLTLGSDGTTLSGFTRGGSSGDQGVSFQLDLSNSVLNITTNDASDGWGPNGPLIQSAVDGNFYGTTPAPTYKLTGTLFRASTTGQFETVIHFGYDGDAIGIEPTGVLVQDPDGWIYGTAHRSNRSPYYYGTVFRFLPGTQMTFETLVEFNTTTGQVYDEPFALSTLGYVYVITLPCPGATGGCIWKVAKSGGAAFQVVQFNNTHYPKSGLFAGVDGSLYGLLTGGATGRGVFYRIGPDDSFAIVADLLDGFATGGSFARDIMFTLAPDGSFYGFSKTGGTFNNGMACRLTTSGNFTLLSSFNSNPLSNTSLYSPIGAPTLGQDGALFGIAYSGRTNQHVAFRLNQVDGTATILADFSASVHGRLASGGLTLGDDLAFYGTTSVFGPLDPTGQGGGTLFKMQLQFSFPNSTTESLTASTTTVQVASSFSALLTTSIAPTSTTSAKQTSTDPADTPRANTEGATKTTTTAQTTSTIFQAGTPSSIAALSTKTPLYYPFGVQLEVSETTLTASDWSVCYSGTYDQNFGTEAPVAIANCTKPFVAVACRPAGTTTNQVIAFGSRTAVFTGDFSSWPDVPPVQNVSFTTDNGVNFYAFNRGSFGFVNGSLTDTYMTPCDITDSFPLSPGQGDSGAYRLCWHTEFNPSGGWRCGLDYDVYDTSFERVVYHADNPTTVNRSTSFSLSATSSADTTTSQATMRTSSIPTTPFSLTSSTGNAASAAPADFGSTIGLASSNTKATSVLSTTSTAARTTTLGTSYPETGSIMSRFTTVGAAVSTTEITTIARESTVTRTSVSTVITGTASSSPSRSTTATNALETSSSTMSAEKELATATGGAGTTETLTPVGEETTTTSPAPLTTTTHKGAFWTSTICATPRAPIPDLGEINSEIVVPADLPTLIDFNVVVTFSHPCPYDISAYLYQQPTDRSLYLFNGAFQSYGCVNGTTVRITVDDNWNTYEPDSILPGNWTAMAYAQYMNQLKGISPSGTWRLNMIDNVLAYSGVLDSWCLELTFASVCYASDAAFGWTSTEPATPFAGSIALDAGFWPCRTNVTYNGDQSQFVPGFSNSSQAPLDCNYGA